MLDNPKVAPALKKAVDLIISSQKRSRFKAWRYTPDANDADTTVSGCQIVALYAALSEINTGQEKIITIEDPVEYQLPGVLQIPVNEKKGLTFARGLRSILRHDPDRIMVGEIRDPETAQIAIQAALTGHLVLSTVHANNVFDVIGRFTHMDVDPYSFVSALTGVLAQRLVRVNCVHCSEIVSVTEAALRESLIDPARTEGRVLREAFEEAPEVKTIPSWEATYRSYKSHKTYSTHLSDQDNKALLQQFVDLGYINEISDDPGEAAEETNRENTWNMARACMDTGRHEQALHAQLHQRVIVDGDAGRLTVTLDIVADGIVGLQDRAEVKVAGDYGGPVKAFNPEQPATTTP